MTLFFKPFKSHKEKKKSIFKRIVKNFTQVVFHATGIFSYSSRHYSFFSPPGLFFRTESDHVISAVIATPPTVQSVNRIMCYPEPLTSVPSGPPHAKRSRFPSGPAVLILTDLAPLLTFDPIKCSVLLRFSTEEAGSASQHCELDSVDLKGALEGKFQPRLLEDCDADSGRVCAGDGNGLLA